MHKKETFGFNYSGLNLVTYRLSNNRSNIQFARTNHVNFHIGVSRGLDKSTAYFL